MPTLAPFIFAGWVSFGGWGGGWGVGGGGVSEMFLAGLCCWNFEYIPYSYNFQTDK